jgi:hypothetical protein
MTGCNVKQIVDSIQAGFELGKHGGRPTAETIAAEIDKANKLLPRKIDAITMLTQLEFEAPDLVTFRYDVTLSSLTPKWGNQESKRLETEARHLAKSDAGVQMLLGMGLRLRHNYRTTTGRMLCEFEITNTPTRVESTADKVAMPEMTPVDFHSMTPEEYKPVPHPNGGIQLNPFFDGSSG